nr:bifunctional DNA primase/polymerase [Burkholderiaceae bacterium]
KDASTDPDVVRAWWGRWPTAQIGLATGPGSRLWVLDSDVKNGVNGEQELDRLTATHGCLPECPTVRTPTGGWHRYFAYPTDIAIRNSASRIAPGLDVRGDGGYVILPPSTGYEWAEFDDLVPPPAPAWLVALVVANERTDTAGAATSIAIGTIPNGRRNDMLARLAGTMRRTGMPREAIEAALWETNRQRCSPPLDQLEIGRIAASISRYEPDQVTVALVEGWAAEMFGSSESDEPQAPDSIGDPGQFPDALLHVPGTVGALCEYINRTSFKRQPVLALAAALPAFGALIGRKVETITRGRSNLYTLGVCKSGGGKERARQGIKEVFVAAGADSYLGPEDLASESGMMAVLVRQPSSLFQLDEVGRMLRAINDPKAGAHLTGIVSAWLKLYSNAASVYKGKAYADPDKNPVIVQPNVCVYGTTVPESLWEALGGESAHNGFLARMLIFVSGDHNPPRQVPEPMIPPGALVERVRWWHQQACGAGNLASNHPSPRVVTRTAEAEAIMADLDGLVRGEMAAMAGDRLESLWTRTELQADQLSLIYACSRDNVAPTIDAEAARWAVDLAVYQTRRLLWECRRFVAENQTESDSKRVLRLIEDAGEAGITQYALTRATQWIRGRQRERTEILLGLKEGGLIRAERRGTATKPADVWVAPAATKRLRVVQ